MNQIKAKIYYLISTGEILFTTAEMQGDVLATTKEQDMEIHQQLQEKSIDEVDFIALEYGTLADIFTNIKSYSVDVVNKKFVPVYYTQEELNTMQQQNQETQDLYSRVSDMTTYLNNSDTTTISNMENSILEIERNKILLNGGM